MMLCTWGGGAFPIHNFLSMKYHHLSKKMQTDSGTFSQLTLWSISSKFIVKTSFITFDTMAVHFQTNSLRSSSLTKMNTTQLKCPLLYIYIRDHPAKSPLFWIIYASEKAEWGLTYRSSKAISILWLCCKKPNLKNKQETSNRKIRSDWHQQIKENEMQ